MAASLQTLFLVMFCLVSPLIVSGDRLETLNVPVLEFLGSVRSTVDTVRQVISTVSNFRGKFIDFRLSNAICDCINLLELSLDELNWTLSASQNRDGIFTAYSMRILCAAFGKFIFVKDFEDFNFYILELGTVVQNFCC